MTTRMDFEEVSRMDDLISRKSILTSFQEYCDRNCPFSEKQRDVMCKACSMGDAIAIVENADGQPEWEKAHWIRKENAVAIYYNCSSCRGALNWRGRFCPYCGAEMENRAG